MFDHVGFNVSDFQKSLAFYRAALEPLPDLPGQLPLAAG